MMNYLDFNAQPALGVDSNGVNMVMSLFDSNDKAWLTQSTSSVFRWACAGIAKRLSNSTMADIFNAFFKVILF